MTARGSRHLGSVRVAAGTLLLAVVLLAGSADAQPAPKAPAAPAATSSVEQGVLRRDPPVASATSKPTTQKSAATAANRSRPGFDTTRVLVVLAGIIALIFLLRWIARRHFGVGVPGGRSTRAVQVLSRSPLSPRQNLVLLRVGRRLLVVADGGGQMKTLSEITDPDEVAALLGQLQDDHNDRAKALFGNLFGMMRSKFDAADAGAVDEQRADASDDREPAEHAPDPAIESTRQELSSLVDKVRLISRQFKAP